MEKLNLDSESPAKVEIRRDVVDAPVPLVSEPGFSRGGEEDRRKRWASVHYPHTVFAHFLPNAFGLGTAL